MKRMKLLKQSRLKRAARVRARVRGTATHPRLSVFRSNSSMYAQLINDDAGKTIAFASFKEVKNAKREGMSTGVAKAYELGRLLAEKAKQANCSSVVFDRGGYAYHGRVKAFAEGAREGGLKF